MTTTTLPISHGSINRNLIRFDRSKSISK